MITVLNEVESENTPLAALTNKKQEIEEEKSSTDGTPGICVDGLIQEKTSPVATIQR